MPCKKPLTIVIFLTKSLLSTLGIAGGTNELTSGQVICDFLTPSMKTLCSYPDELCRPLIESWQFFLSLANFWIETFSQLPWLSDL
jgi:hypothetical protein